MNTVHVYPEYTESVACIDILYVIVLLYRCHIYYPIEYELVWDRIKLFMKHW